ncbi:MAG: lactate racemase domain-containing protein [Mycobacterium leprae]
MNYLMFERGTLPRWAEVRYQIDPTEITDVDAAVETALSKVSGRIRPGQTVCLTVGSRGIDRIAEVARAMVTQIRQLGAEVFIIPAMGSHGGATAEGQLEVLASYGVTPESMGCDIRASMETACIGEVEGGVPVFVDRYAYEADVIIPMNRVKPHTDFHGPVESGLLKMIAIGLGKQKGADTFHAQGFAEFHRLIPAVGRYTIAKLNIPFGVALVENGHARLSMIEAVESERIWEREQELLQTARERMARLPIKALDVLILDYIGKDISGLGMDSNVVGRYYTGPTGTGPDIQRIIVRDLTPDTEGNAVGIGMADVALSQAVRKMDIEKTYMNCITAKTPEGARVALTVDTDREAVAVALACSLKVTTEQARIVRLRDTKHLDRFYATESLLPELLATGRCEVVGELHAIQFDEQGMLIDKEV